MKRSARFCLAVFAILSLAGGLARADKIRLPERFQKWLDQEVPYIITSRERGVFLKLATDRERDAFIEAFWKQRDPTPGTPENEFRTEHYRRLNYANLNFGRSSVRPGWATDRGRIYIILGEPRTIETYDTINGVYPVEIWFYQPDTSKGLPAAFDVIFYKPYGTGDYVLYSPSHDGPESLIADSMQNFSSDLAAYQQLRQLAPNLAPEILSLIPGEQVPVGGVSLASDRLMKDIYESPQKKIDDAYAEALLKYKDRVEVEYTANYIGCEAQAQVFRGESGPFVIHFSVEPDKLSVDEFGGAYSANFELNGRLTDPAGRTVYQFDRQFGLSLTSQDLAALQGTTLTLEDMFPCLPGRYLFDLLIKNTISKEFATYEVGLEVPALVPSHPVLGAPLLAYGLESVTAAEAGERVPFELGGRQALSQARKIFTARDTLYIIFQVYGQDATGGVDSVRLTYEKDGKPVLTQGRSLAELKYGNAFAESQTLASFAPGYYDLTLTLLGSGGQAVDSRQAHFELSPAVSVPRPRIMAKVFKAENRAEWDYDLGLQALGLDALDQGRTYFEKAFSQKPSDVRFALGYAECLFRLKDYTKARGILLPLAKAEDVPPEVLSLLGRTNHALGRYAEAIANYQDYLSRAGTNLEILNLIGTCQYQSGDRAAALATWRKSLAINPNQKQIKDLVDSIK